MTKGLVSIIVPVYNTEDYLAKCVQSLVKQTYTDIEILLIDDGSTDGSGELCDQFAEGYNHIQAFHKQNGGLSDARNYGIMQASGEYICFVDSDDYVSFDMVSDLYMACRQNEVRIAWGNKARVLENGKIYPDNVFTEGKMLTNKEAFKQVLLHESTSVCDKMYHQSLFQEVMFPKGRLYEDIFTIRELFAQCEFIYHTGKTHYYYLQRTESIIHSEFSEKKLDYIRNAQIFIEYTLNRYPDLKEETDCYYNLILCTVLCDMYATRMKFKQEYMTRMKEFKRNKNVIWKNKYISVYKKVMCYFVMLHMTNVVLFLKRRKNVFYDLKEGRK